MSLDLKDPDQVSASAVASRPVIEAHPLTRVAVRCSHAWLARVQDLADVLHLDAATTIEHALYRLAEGAGDNRPWPDRTGKVRLGSLAHPHPHPHDVAADRRYREVVHQLDRPGLDPDAKPLDASGRFYGEPVP